MPDGPVIRWKNVYENAIRIFSALRIEFGQDNFIIAFCLKVVLKPTESFKLAFCTPDLEAWAIQRMHEVHSDYGEQEDATNPEGLGNPNSNTGRVLQESKEDGEAAEALNSRPTEEVASRKSRARRCGGYTPKRARSGSLEDA